MCNKCGYCMVCRLLRLRKEKPRLEINKDSEEVVYTDAKQELVANVENKEKDESKDTPKDQPTDDSTDAEK